MPRFFRPSKLFARAYQCGWVALASKLSCKLVPNSPVKKATTGVTGSGDAEAPNHCKISQNRQIAFSEQIKMFFKAKQKMLADKGARVVEFSNENWKSG